MTNKVLIILFFLGQKMIINYRKYLPAPATKIKKSYKFFFWMEDHQDSYIDLVKMWDMDCFTLNHTHSLFTLLKKSTSRRSIILLIYHACCWCLMDLISSRLVGVCHVCQCLSVPVSVCQRLLMFVSVSVFAIGWLAVFTVAFVASVAPCQRNDLWSFLYISWIFEYFICYSFYDFVWIFAWKKSIGSWHSSALTFSYCFPTLFYWKLKICVD